MEFGFFAGVAVFGKKQVTGEMKDNGGRADVFQMLDREGDTLADDAFVANDGRANQVGGQTERRVGAEFGGEASVGQFDAVAFDTREADFERVAFGPHGANADGWPGRFGRRDDGLGGEVERDAENVGVFDGQQPVFVEVVGLAAQAAPDDLFTKQLRAEGADAENVGDGVGIPAFREH